MAIHKEVNKVTGSNAAQIDANLDWATALRVRMSEYDQSRYGAWNVFRFVNDTGQDVVISWTWDVGRTESETIKANSVRNINVPDGIKSYGFDIYATHALDDIAAGTFKYTCATVLELPEL